MKFVSGIKLAQTDKLIAITRAEILGSTVAKCVFDVCHATEQI